MKRLLILIPAALMALPAFAQEAPEGSYRDLWCGIAFGTAAQGAPFSDEDVAAARAAGDQATDEQKAIIEQADMVTAFVSGGQALVDKATAAYKGAGFTDEAFATVRTDLEPKVASQVTGAGADAEFTFEECSSILPEDNPMHMPLEGQPAQ
jgi:hypothetical protein